MRQALRLLILSLAVFAASLAQAEVYESDYAPGFGRFRFEVKGQGGAAPQVVVSHDQSSCQFTPYGTPTPCEMQQTQSAWEPRLVGDGAGVDHIEGQWSRFRFEGVEELAKYRLIRLNQRRTNQSVVRLLILGDDGSVKKVFRLNKVGE